MTEEHIEDEIKKTGNFRESFPQMMVEIDEIQISQSISLILIR